MENVETKPKKEWRDQTAWVLFMGLLILIGGNIIGELLMKDINLEQAYWYTFMQYMSFWTIWVAVLFGIFAFKKNREIKNVLTTKAKGNRISYLLWGFLLGGVLNGFCAAIAFFNGDFKLEFVKFEFLPIVGLFLAVFVQSSAEEVLCRGVVYQRLLKATSKHSHAFAILVNSLFFAVLHLFNDGITFLSFYSVFIAGVFFSLMIYYYDSLWMAMASHTTWNFTQSILLGLPNSGASFPYSVFRLKKETLHQSFAYDIGFGVEGAVLSSVLMTLCCLGMIVWKRRGGKIKFLH